MPRLTRNWPVLPAGLSGKTFLMKIPLMGEPLPVDTSTWRQKKKTWAESRWHLSELDAEPGKRVSEGRYICRTFPPTMLMPRLLAGSRTILTLRSGPQCRAKMVGLGLIPLLGEAPPTPAALPMAEVEPGTCSWPTLVMFFRTGNPIKIFFHYGQPSGEHTCRIVVVELDRSSSFGDSPLSPSILLELESWASVSVKSLGSESALSTPEGGSCGGVGRVTSLEMLSSWICTVVGGSSAFTTTWESKLRDEVKIDALNKERVKMSHQNQKPPNIVPLFLVRWSK